MKVKNLNGTSDKKPSCGCRDWISHWKKEKIFIPMACKSCKEDKELLGGHVIKQDSDDKREYIVPICSSCNNTKDKVFEVDSVFLVLANKCAEY